MNVSNDINEYNKSYETYRAHYIALAKRAKRENRRMFNHICIRVDDIDAAEKLLGESFGISNFVRLSGKLFKGESKLSVAWISEEVYLELMQPTEKQGLGFDTGCGHPIGHLSEAGFFVLDMDRELERLAKLGWKVTDSIEGGWARMYKIDTEDPSGFPVELIDVAFDDNELRDD